MNLSLFRCQTIVYVTCPYALTQLIVSDFARKICDVWNSNESDWMIDRKDRFSAR